MKGTYVHKDTGRPLAFTDKGAKQGLEQQGHPFLENVRLHEGHDISAGVFYKWDFVNQQWVLDTEKNNEFRQAQQAKEDRRADVEQKLETVKANQGNAGTIRSDLDAIVDIVEYVKDKVQ